MCSNFSINAETNSTISLSLDYINQIGTQTTLCSHLTLSLYNSNTKFKKSYCRGKNNSGWKDRRRQDSFWFIESEDSWGDNLTETSVKGWVEFQQVDSVNHKKRREYLF